MRPIRIFLLKGVESIIDHVKSIETLGCVYWRKTRSKKFSNGDICYLYLSGKSHNQIRYRLEVVDISCERIDKDCWVVPFQPNHDCYKLIPIAPKYEGNELNLDRLEDIGINRYTQFKKLDEFQDEILSKYFG